MREGFTVQQYNGNSNKMKSSHNAAATFCLFDKAHDNKDFYYIYILCCVIGGITGITRSMSHLQPITLLITFGEDSTRLYCSLLEMKTTPTF